MVKCASPETIEREIVDRATLVAMDGAGKSRAARGLDIAALRARGWRMKNHGSSLAALALALCLPACAAALKGYEGGPVPDAQTATLHSGKDVYVSAPGFAYTQEDDATYSLKAGPQSLTAIYELRNLTKTGKQVGNMVEYKYSSNRSVRQPLEFVAQPGRSYRLSSQACSEDDTDRSFEVQDESDGYKVVGEAAITCADLQAVARIEGEADAYLKAKSVYNRESVLINWRTDCLKCHGASGKGDTRLGRKLKVPDFASARWQAATPNADIIKAVTTKDGPNHLLGGTVASDTAATWVMLIRWLGRG